MPRTALLLLAALIVTWGLNWPAMKFALAEIQPWAFRTLCALVGGSCLVAIAKLGGGSIRFPLHRLPQLAFVSLFNITGWHLFSAYALLHTGSGRAVIIGYTMPLWASALSMLVLGARLSLRQGCALLLGLGALVLLLANDLATLGSAPIGILLMLGAAMCWATGTVLVKRFDWGNLPVTALTGWQLLLGGVPIVIGWWLLEPVPDLTALSLPAALGLAYAVFVAMVFCMSTYFRLVTMLPAHVAAISVLPVPIVGLASSAWLLGEPVGAAEAGALALVVGGLFLVLRPARR